VCADQGGGSVGSGCFAWHVEALRGALCVLRGIFTVKSGVRLSGAYFQNKEETNMSGKKKEYKIEGRKKTIYRVRKSAENPYVMIDRRPIDNPLLSYKAKGILTYLMSRPDGWEVSVSDLVNHATDGDDSIRAGLKELEKAGHTKHTRMRDKGRITGWLIEVYEVPHADFPDMDKPDEDLPDMENPTQVLSKLSNTERKKKVSSSGLSTTTAEFSYSRKDIIKLCAIYGENIGYVSSTRRAEIRRAANAYSLLWVKDAIEEAVLSNVRKWNYVFAILKRWELEGKD